MRVPFGVIQVAILLGAIGTLAVGWRMRRSSAGTVGTWRCMRAGALVWISLILATLGSGLLLLVYFGTDWSRYPHGDQSGAVLTMAVGFGVGAIWAVTAIIASSLRWNDEVVQQRDIFLRRKQIAWRDLATSIPSQSARTLTLVDRNRVMIRVPIDAHGFDDLLADAARLSPGFGAPDARPASRPHAAGVTGRPLRE